ncbi:MAG: Uma2 family endonuclease [Hyphomicrobium sp.]
MTGFAEDPQAACGRPIDKQAFLHWVQRQQGRFEFKDGQVVMHAGSTKRHSWISADFITAFARRLDPSQWAIGTAVIAVEIADEIRYPDAIVERRTSDGREISTDTPVVLVEVLSPSSVGRDMNAKLAEYTSLASLQAYIVASQDEPIVWVWQRDAATRAFPAKPVEISGADQAIKLTDLEISLPMSELFQAIPSA